MARTRLVSNYLLTCDVFSHLYANKLPSYFVTLLVGDSYDVAVPFAELTVLGELKHEGMLMENNKHRMVFLFESMIIIAKPKEDSRLQFKHYINVSLLFLI